MPPLTAPRRPAGRPQPLRTACNAVPLLPRKGPGRLEQVEPGAPSPPPAAAASRASCTSSAAAVASRSLVVPDMRCECPRCPPSTGGRSYRSVSTAAAAQSLRRALAPDSLPNPRRNTLAWPTFPCSPPAHGGAPSSRAGVQVGRIAAAKPARCAAAMHNSLHNLHVARSCLIWCCRLILPHPARECCLPANRTLGPLTLGDRCSPVGNSLNHPPPPSPTRPTLPTATGRHSPSHPLAPRRCMTTGARLWSDTGHCPAWAAAAAPPTHTSPLRCVVRCSLVETCASWCCARWPAKVHVTAPGSSAAVGLHTAAMCGCPSATPRRQSASDSG